MKRFSLLVRGQIRRGKWPTACSRVSSDAWNVALSSIGDRQRTKALTTDLLAVFFLLFGDGLWCGLGCSRSSRDAVAPRSLNPPRNRWIGSLLDVERNAYSAPIDIARAETKTSALIRLKTMENAEHKEDVQQPTAEDDSTIQLRLVGILTGAEGPLSPVEEFDLVSGYISASSSRTIFTLACQTLEKVPRYHGLLHA